MFNFRPIFWNLAIWMGCIVAQAETDVDKLVEQGEFSKAEQILREQLADPDAPVVEPAAIELENLRRTRREFSVSEAQVLAELRKGIDDVSIDDVRRWRDAGLLTHRVIDGEARYFLRAASNLFRRSEEASERRNEQSKAAERTRLAKKYDVTSHVVQLVALSENAASAEVMPVQHRVKYRLAVDANHPRVKAGAKVRVWLPFPQEYRQQRDVSLVSAIPSPAHIASKDSPHRTIYFEQTVARAEDPIAFEAEYTFVTSAYCPKLEPADVQPYDTDSELYRNYTAERAPHIVFTPQLREQAASIVGSEQNPLEKARRIFAWVSKNIQWCGEQEYSIIPSLSAKGIAAGHGDCGVQGMAFITLCRAAGIPARWQSGWQTKPGDWNMHDWSEIYIEPWGWLPADASYGLREHSDPRVETFYCGHMDPYRLIVNLDYARPLDPQKTSYRSEPNDFQRGEIEIDGHNLYFNEWSWHFDVETTPLAPVSDVAN